MRKWLHLIKRPQRTWQATVIHVMNRLTMMMTTTMMMMRKEVTNDHYKHHHHQEKGDNEELIMVVLATIKSTMTMRNHWRCNCWRWLCLWWRWRVIGCWDAGRGVTKPLPSDDRSPFCLRRRPSRTHMFVSKHPLFLKFEETLTETIKNTHQNTPLKFDS